MGCLADDTPGRPRVFGPDQRPDVAAEPERSVDVGPKVHLAGEQEGKGSAFRRRLGPLIGGRVDTVGDHLDLQAGHQALERGAIGARDRDHAIRPAAGGGLKPAQAPPLQEGIGGRVPARGEAKIGLKGTLLEDIFGVVVVKNNQGARGGAFEEGQVGRQLDPFNLNDVKGLGL